MMLNQGGSSLKGSGRKLSRVSGIEMETINEMAKGVYEAYLAEEDEDGDRLFEVECLVKLCNDKGLIGPKLSEKNVSMIFNQVKLKKKTFLKFERFQEALRKISTLVEKTYQELVADLSDGIVDSKAALARRKSVASASKKDLYELIKPLGKGGAGTTVHVKHTTSGSEFAAKAIHCHDLQEALSANDEAKIMALMKGPQFVTFVDSFFTPASYGTYELFIIMEYCARGDFDQFILETKGVGLPEKDIGRILTPVLEGLRQMHARGLVHRDVKPGNILISAAGLAMLADFGLAKQLDRASKTGANTHHVGTVQYMAPEIEQGQYSATIDVFAFGIVLLDACGVKLTKPLRLQGDVDAAIAQIPSNYTAHFVAAVQAAITIKSEDRTRPMRPSALDLLKTPFFAPHFDALPDEMIKEVIALAQTGPWAVFRNVSGLSWEIKHPTSKVRISRTNGISDKVS
jgi:serine/threonine protein kinase